MSKQFVMPNLPGYGTSKGQSRNKAQTFTFVNGYAMEVPASEKNVCTFHTPSFCSGHPISIFSFSFFSIHNIEREVKIIYVQICISERETERERDIRKKTHSSLRPTHTHHTLNTFRLSVKNVWNKQKEMRKVNQLSLKLETDRYLCG